MHRITVLDNGLSVITCEMPHMESVAVGFWIGVGGRYEEKRLNGISHFLEHILFKGTKKRSATRISREIESVGGSLNGFTSNESTCYTVKVPAKRLGLACDVLADMYLNPAIREEDIMREKAVVREEINMYRDTPQYYVSELFQRALWGDHPLGRPLPGTTETVLSMTGSDLRKYQKRNYIPRNTVIAAAGRLRHEKLVNIIKTLLYHAVSAPVPDYVPVGRKRKKPVFVLQRKETEQTHLCVGVRAYRRDHPSRFSLYLLSIALGENMSSRLFQTVREKKGLAYAIHSSVICFHDTGAFIVSAGVENSKFLQAITTILRELKKAGEHGLKKAELARAKEYFMGQFAMGMERTMPNMLSLGENLLCSGRVLTKEEIFSRLLAVSVGDVQRVAADILIDNQISLAVIGPLPERDEKIADILHL